MPLIPLVSDLSTAIRAIASDLWRGLAGPSRHFDAIVVSYGGVGTTFFLEFLQKRLTVNSRNSLEDGIKHINAPGHPVLKGATVERAIYVYGDPRLAVMSLFRRNYQALMIPKLRSSRHRSGPEYRRSVKSKPFVVDFNQFLERGEDLFGLQEHWHNWTTDPLRFPTLFVRFEQFHQHLPQIFDFLRLPESHLLEFPPPIERHTSLGQLSASELSSLNAIYGNLLSELDSRPPIFIREASS